MERTALRLKSYWENFLLSHPVVGSHIMRIGLIRTAAGGGSMYFSIPLFILFHLFGIEIFFQRIVTPLLGLEKTPSRHYLIIDRYQIKGLPLFDKFNCVFCGYANGITVLFNEKIEQMAAYGDEPGIVHFVKEALIIFSMIMFYPFFYIIAFFGIEIIYDILVSRPLRMHRTTSEEISSNLKQKGFCAGRKGMSVRFLRRQKVVAIRLLAVLEQIESSWCPLKHIAKGKDLHYPEHHKNFFEAHEIEKMRKVLQTTGTASEMKPYK